MAIALSAAKEDGPNGKPVISLKLLGCHGCNKPGCGHLVAFEERVSDSKIVTPITRLFLHFNYGRRNRLDAMLDKFTAYFDENKHQDEDGLVKLQNIILEDHETDDSWKTCAKCKEEYAKGERLWQFIHYTVPSEPACPEHEHEDE